jgi:hypothetical protein
MFSICRFAAQFERMSNDRHWAALQHHPTHCACALRWQESVAATGVLIGGVGWG